MFSTALTMIHNESSKVSTSSPPKYQGDFCVAEAYRPDPPSSTGVNVFKRHLSFPCFIIQDGGPSEEHAVYAVYMSDEMEIKIKQEHLKRLLQCRDVSLDLVKRSYYKGST